MTTLVVASVLRSLLMAAMVWAGLKLLLVRHVLAQKIAWALVLLLAFAMPLLMRWQAAHPGTALRVTVRQTAAVAAIEKRVSSIQIAPPTRDSSRFVETLPSAVELPITSLQDSAPAAASTWHAADLVRYIIPTYLLVAGALLLRLLFGLALAMRIWNRAERASPILEPRATVRISASIKSPVTIGSGIVLPADYTAWDRSKLRVVLAHERSHVRQGDFYLQLLASLYSALLWFSPLGWYLKRRLAALGEALSDRAALLEADDHSSYAEVLLEFAAMPRHSFAGVTAGVGMARSSNIQSRIERILNDRSFRAAFVSGRRHAVIATLLAPCGLVLATSLLHVQAAEKVQAKTITALRADLQSAPTAPQPASTARVKAGAELPVIEAIARPDAAPAVKLAEDAAEEDIQEAPAPAPTAVENGSFAIVDGEKGVTDSGSGHEVYMGSWDDHGELDRVRTKVQGSFLWFERDGKSYVITDPALVAQVKALYAPQSELGKREAELGRQQAELGMQQGQLAAQQAMVKVPTPDISKDMAELQQAVQMLAAEKTQEITQDRLSQLQAKLGAMQGKLAQAEALAGSRQAILGSQEGSLGDKEAELGRQEAELGREQGRIARQAAQQARSLIDQALRDGKAKPVD